MQRGLDATAWLWPDVRVAYGWVPRGAPILNNESQLAEATVQRRRQGLLGALGQPPAKAGTLAPAVGHWVQVSRSSWPGRFHGESIPHLPRTHNDLAQFFGA